MAIRFDNKLNQDINKTVKNFNQKIARLEKQERELLPSKIRKKELKQYEDRQELKRKLKELQRFSKRGAEQIVTLPGGVRLTKYQLENIKKDVAIAKANVTRELNRMKLETPKVLGKKQASTYSEMGDTEFLNYVAKQRALGKKIETMKIDEFNRLYSLVQKTSKRKYYKKAMFKENYKTMLTDLGYYIKYDKRKLKELEDKISKLPTNKFVKLFNDKAVRSITEYYPMVANTSMNPEDIEDDVTILYDALIENLDDIIKDL